MKYTNPILHFDFSDPDVIRVKDDFYMVASSFNHLPGLPILHSKNLVEWEIINYAVNELPEKFNEVVHGEGIWAPSIRYNDGTFYILIPMPDEGIFEVHSKDIYGSFSKMHPIIEGRGYEDPCPIWVNDKAYIVFGFVKSRIGFNSLLAIVEVDTKLNKTIGDYKIVYDGHDMNPTIEGPKFNYRNGYFYIMAPAGSVKGGWQTCLRSKNIYGPYEAKIVLYQGDSLVNGPHQGALVDLDDDLNKYAFVHFQDKRAYGRIVHLEPVTFFNDWPIIGHANDLLLPGSPVEEDEYPVDIKTDYNIQTTDYFNEDKLSYMWQCPCNMTDFYKLDNGLIMNMLVTNHSDEVNLIKTCLLTKVPASEFSVSTKIDLSNMTNLDHLGFIIFGMKYKALEFVKLNDKFVLNIIDGAFKEKDKVVKSFELAKTEALIEAEFKNKDIYDLIYSIKVNGKDVLKDEKAFAGRWIGAKIGFYAYSEEKSDGYAKIETYITKIK